jgi:hypothetical protein
MAQNREANSQSGCRVKKKKPNSESDERQERCAESGGVAAEKENAASLRAG